VNLTIKAVNFVKSSALNTKPFAVLRADLEADHKTIVSHGIPLAVKRKYAESILRTQA
jgi:hypothetical protein